MPISSSRVQGYISYLGAFDQAQPVSKLCHTVYIFYYSSISLLLTSMRVFVQDVVSNFKFTGSELYFTLKRITYVNVKHGGLKRPFIRLLYSFFDRSLFLLLSCDLFCKILYRTSSSRVQDYILCRSA